ncbi:MAG TPA: hypothetical protein VLE49_06250 [Anaerolineales bacterium]|nr:hypothetical protein [Anaerolineales bacterium]
MRRALFFVLLTLIVAACAPQASATEVAATDQPSIIIKRPTATPTHVRLDLTPAQRAALTALSKKLGLPVDKITLVSTEAVTWPNGCLGIVRMGVMCTQAEVPGFKIVLEANGKKYEFHANQDGSLVQLAEGAQDLGVAEQTVIKQLAANLGYQDSDISVLSSEVVEFRDGCLGVSLPDVMCTQVITPGRIIVLEANGIQYEYHISANGSRVQPATLALVWKRQGGIVGFCDTLTVFLSGEVYASRCKPQPDGRMGTFADLLSAEEQAKFSDWMTTFAVTNLDASDPKGVADRMMVTLEVFGTGTKPPSPAEQQALFQFSQDLFRKLIR